MMRKLLAGLGGLLLVLGGLFWWFVADARAPAAAPGLIDLAAYRALVAADGQARPTSLNVEITGVDTVPRFAAEAGEFSGTYRTAYTAFQIVGPSGSIVVDGAVDQAVAADMARSADARFDGAAYARLLAAMEQANRLVLTHEHLDHVIAFARHPDGGALAGKMALTVEQLAVLPRHAHANGLHPALSAVAPVRFDGPTRIAPGVVVVPMRGHSPGSQLIFVQTSTGREYLLVGDIVWTFSSLDTLKTRPRFLQFMLFDPDEERQRVLAQVRALHDLRAAEPALIIIPSHDLIRLESLIADGVIGGQFALAPSDQTPAVSTP
jgi:glyoxylase-like metal-dependent hydrolase (beta-lactamase superfamily II)